ncbi:hypothetical protein M3484_20820 [Pseudomonas sp. GX19020]|uniref:hypothetical protein n=1 Tax=Pseudomonas sp. GX19020 TaxID=2942277 RepID=UPI0020186CDA|nr:hypothetical protein [Pseudomonas sp. GX19020]MCL4069004.1 hypothetical protein [Pseudomonas sp. GX19020]
MTHYRSRYRAVIQAALTASPRFADFTVRSAWAQNISAEDLPVFGIATPVESKNRDSLDTSERETTVHIVFKRLGLDDIEDILDEDSAAAETAILDALQASGIQGDLAQTEIRLDGAGEQRAGSLTMTFRLMAFLVEPLTP